LKPIFINPRSNQLDAVDTSGVGEYYNVWHSSFNAKTGILPSVRSPIPDNGIIVIIDSGHMFCLDYLITFKVPILLLNFAPSVVSATRSDYSFFFADNMVQFRVNGGAIYEHPVVTFPNDHFVYEGWFKSHTAQIESRWFAQDFNISLITPVSVTWLVGFLRPGPPLAFLQPNQVPGFSALATSGNGKAVVSIGTEGAIHQVKMDEKVFASCFQLSVASSAFGSAAVETVLRQNCEPDKANPLINKASLIKNYIVAGGKPPRAVGVPKNNVVPPMTVSRRQFDGPESDPDDKRLMRPWCLPIYDATLPNQRGLNTECNTVQDRVSEPQSHAQGVIRNYQTSMLEFTRWLTDGHAKTLSPVSFDEILLHQDSASKRRNFEAGMLGATGKDNFSRSFVKAEPSSLLKPWRGPRLISTFAPDWKIRMSRFSIALYSWMMEYRSQYIGSGHPSAIAERVAAITTCDFVLVADASNFDGSMGHWHVELENLVLCTLFGDEQSEEIRDIMHNQENISARTSSGVRYSTQASRHSGSPFTTISNTICSLYLLWCGYRVNYSRDQAAIMMQRGALAAGDDVIAGGLDILWFDLVVKKFKMVYKSHIVDYGLDGGNECFMGVDFLSVFYPQRGSARCTIDLVRFLSKWHWTTQDTDVPIHEVAFNKAVSALITYGCGGVLGTYLQKLVGMIADEHPTLTFRDAGAATFVSQPFVAQFVGQKYGTRFWEKGDPSMEQPLWPCFPDDTLMAYQCEIAGINFELFKEHVFKQHDSVDSLLNHPLCGFIAPPLHELPAGHAGFSIDGTTAAPQAATSPDSGGVFSDVNQIPPGSGMNDDKFIFEEEPKFVFPKHSATWLDKKVLDYLIAPGPKITVGKKKYKDLATWLRTEFDFREENVRKWSDHFLAKERVRRGFSPTGEREPVWRPTGVMPEGSQEKSGPAAKPRDSDPFAFLDAEKQRKLPDFTKPPEMVRVPIYQSSIPPPSVKETEEDKLMRFYEPNKYDREAIEQARGWAYHAAMYGNKGKIMEDHRKSYPDNVFGIACRRAFDSGVREAELAMTPKLSAIEESVGGEPVGYKLVPNIPPPSRPVSNGGRTMGQRNAQDRKDAEKKKPKSADRKARSQQRAASFRSALDRKIGQAVVPSGISSVFAPTAPTAVPKAAGQGFVFGGQLKDLPTLVDEPVAAKAKPSSRDNSPPPPLKSAGGSSQ
jgi:hypothetical protein